ncbi:MAG: hypothetical protein D3924_16400 [Candidatus Electrothrix sp. AR4]|nr:hypothetical protein [Candidatus Electrothrix sp. AR4]
MNFSCRLIRQLHNHPKKVDTFFKDNAAKAHRSLRTIPERSKIKQSKQCELSAFGALKQT